MSTAAANATWARVALGSIASVSRGASPRPIASPRWFSDDSNIGWVRIADVGRSDGLTLRTTTQRLSSDGVTRSKFLPSGTLIMSIAATVGVPVVTGLPACIHDGFVAIENLRGVDQTYLLYVLKSQQDELRMMGQTGSQSNVNSEIVKGLQIPLPSIGEQKAIVAALVDTDRLLSALERQVAKKQAIKQGMMQQLLTGRVRLPGFGATWSQIRAGEVGYFKGGSGFPVRYQGSASGDLPFYKVSDMNHTGNELFMTTSNNYIASGQQKAMGAVIQPAGAIVFAKVGAAIFLERKRILSKTSCIDNNMAAYIPDGAKADTRFVHYAFTNFRFSSLVATGALPSLNGRQLRSIPLGLPPTLSEQQAIADTLGDVDAEIALLNTRLVKARSIKQGMTQQLLTGRARLPVEECAA